MVSPAIPSKKYNMFRAVEENIHTVFREQRYVVPFYQRPYAWEQGNAEELFTDLLEAFNLVGKGAGSYFLGTIVLIDGDADSRHQVVDGQQRLVTLQLLILAISEQIVDAPKRDNLTEYIRSKENIFAGTGSEPIIEIGERYQSFFKKIAYGEAVEDPVALSGPEKLMLDNLIYFRTRCKELKQDQLLKFGVFVLQNCYVASLKAASEIDALRIFSVLNDRGVDLHPVDILKARLIASTGLSIGAQEKAAAEWEEIEFQLGRTNFQALFNHLRMIFVRQRTKRLLHEEIMEELDSRAKVRAFLEETLPTFADIYADVLNPAENDIRQLVKVLEASGQRDWVPPFMFVLKNRKILGQLTSRLLRKLTALSMMMLSTSFTDGQRVGRYGRVISEIDDLIRKKKHADDLIHIQISEKEFAAAKNALTVTAYFIRNIKAFLLWSETLVGDTDRSIESARMSVEHILPQSIEGEEYWESRFDLSEWARNVHGIGNLALVSSRMNNKLARRPFAEKKAIIERRVGSGWLLTDMILREADWDKAALGRRTDRILKAAKSAMTGPI